ncbi:component of IIS longevity pathway SMK-1-domain-containing protein [Cantharellus anzutake]|uniref:component of IIS longevity pathway SMK-1-domain-containing protein n=1 Tax=Cantharellus anzutake TaxID=1750568 RepID=UPI001902E859|nr:component of IIS longevity pathway SMK-1-domain-containing protein [Cantharellus anzutake]KAF8339200.1 component of IIS longevity pathway SMK-1-domain-containing protein [Cantharellus anzutake]
MPARSPPPTPVSSPRVSPTPPGSPKQPDVDKHDDTSSSETGLSPSSVPLRPIQQMDSAHPDDMDIDDDPPHSAEHFGSDGQEHINGGGSSSDNEQEWTTDDWMADMRRVKARYSPVYELVGTQWTDRGTALCTGIYDEESDQAAIIAKAEIGDTELLRSEVRMSDVYQRQQETLIVWTEPDGTDWALSFQDVEGCTEIWDFIIEVQRHFRGKNGDDSSSSPLPPGASSQSRLTVASIVASGRLPDPALGIIGDIDTAIKVIAKTIHGRERISEYILTEDYIKQLMDVMEQAEDLESLGDLHALYGIMHTILSINDHGIYDYILNEDVFLGVVGILEYDPEFPSYKASYRDFLKNSSEYLQVIEIRDPNIQRKIHQTYRLQYLKDVVLARVLDDSTFNVLSSYIMRLIETVCSSPEIVNAHIPPNTIILSGAREQAPSPPASPTASTIPLSQAQQNGNNAESVMPTSSSSHSIRTSNSKVDALKFIHQLCLMGKNVQIPTRIALYRALVERGVLFALEWALRLPPPSLKKGKEIELSQARSGSQSESLLAPASIETAGVDEDAWISDADRAALLDAAAEVLIIVVDHHVAGVRSHIVKQFEIEKAREHATAMSAAGGAGIGRGTKDVPFRNQIGDSLRMLLELPNMDAHNANGPEVCSLSHLTLPFGPSVTLVREEYHTDPPAFPAHSTAPGKKTAMVLRLREDPINEHFFPFFYDHCITIMFRPLLEIPEWKKHTGEILRLNREQSSLFLYLCDLLCTFLVQHSHRSQYFVLSSNISTHIATLLRTREKHMRLVALRFFRVCIKANNQFITRHLIKHDIFRSTLELTEREASRDNLISASCQELFEHIRKDNIRVAITHIMDNFGPRIHALAERSVVGPRFKAFITRWEQINAPPPKPDSPSEQAKEPSTLRKWGQGTLDTEEESYFNADDDDEHEAKGAPSSPQQQSLKRKRVSGGVVTRSEAARGRSAELTGLVRQPGRITLNPSMSTSSHTSPIAVPQPYPIRGLGLDYDDNDDDIPFIERPQSPMPISPPPRAASPSPAHNPFVSNTQSSPTSDHTSSPPSPSVPTPEPSLHKRQRGGSITAMDASERAAIAAATSQAGRRPSVGAPPLKRRRDDDDDDEMSLLANKGSLGRRRNPMAANTDPKPSVGAGAAKAKPATETDTKDDLNAKPQAIKESCPTPKEANDKPGAVKKIKLSLKANLGLGNKKSPTPPSPTQANGGKTKDGDEG